MLQFYKKALCFGIVLLAISLFAGYVGVKRTNFSHQLLPPEGGAYALVVEKDTDQLEGGSSYILLNESTDSLDYQLVLKDDVEYPYASLSFVFVDEQGERAHVDLSRYASASFNVKCTPASILSFLVFTHEDERYLPEGNGMGRISEMYFSCDESWQEVEIDLASLDVPEWWIKYTSIDLSNRQYQLEKSIAFAFGTSRQTAENRPIRVKITELTLNGRTTLPLYLFALFALVLWGGYIVWFFRQHTRHLISEVHEKLRKDRPLVAYQQLTIEPQKDRSKNSVLRYMVTEYANPDLSLDTMSADLGISRSKLNAILKAELGYTFTGYLNKLRLAEAARLLSQESQASVAEIAYSVGYKNVPYFNKLFKSEYGCTPKTFKSQGK